MRIIHDITSPQSGGAAVALGFFDGLHLGHRAVIGRMVEEAAKRELAPCVFTFAPDGEIPASKSGLTLLQSATRKESLMESMGVERLVSPSFSDFMQMSPERFVDELLSDALCARVLVCGENYHFGRYAKAGVQELKKLAAIHGIEVITVPPVLYEGELVSSTRIRAALREGKPELAESMLGTPFELEGRVLHGKKLGRTINCPTVNQAIPGDFTIPMYGVYLSLVTTPDGVYWGVSNIGTRPTVDGGTLNCETYLIGFNGDLYGQTISVAPKRLLRLEVKFENVEQLAEQIQVDIKNASDLIKVM